MARPDHLLMAPETTPEDPNEVFRNLLQGVLRHKLLVLLFFLGTVGGTYLTLQFLTENYEAEAQLLVKLGRENVDLPATVSKGAVYTTGVRKEEINSNIELLSSREIIEATIDKIGVEAFLFKPTAPHSLIESIKYYAKTGYRWTRDQIDNLLIAMHLKTRLTDREKVITLMQKSLKLMQVKESDVIAVTVRLPDPDLATNFIDTLLHLYMDRHIEVYKAPEVRSFFDNEVTNLRDQMNVLSSKRETLRNELNLNSISVQKEKLLARLSSIQEEIDKLQNQHAMYEGAAGSKEDAPKLTDPILSKLIPDPSIGTYQENLAQLYLQRMRMGASFNDSVPEVKKLNRQIAQFEGLILTGLTTRIDQLTGQAASLQHELSALNSGEEQLNKVDLETKVAENNFLNYAQRREEARISEMLDQRRVSNVVIQTPPKRPFKPVSPRKLLIMGVSIPLGLMLGIGMALLLNYFDDRIHNRVDLARIEGLPYLGTFYLFPENKPRRQRRSLMWKMRYLPAAGSSSARLLKSLLFIFLVVMSQSS